MGSKFLTLIQAGFVAGLLAEREKWALADEFVKTIKICIEKLPEVKNASRNAALKYATEIFNMPNPEICICGEDFLFSAAVNVAGSLFRERTGTHAAARATQDARHGDCEMFNKRTVVLPLTANRASNASIELQAVATIGGVLFVELPVIKTPELNGTGFYKKWFRGIMEMAQIESVAEFMAGMRNGLLWDTPITAAAKRATTGAYIV